MKVKQIDVRGEIDHDTVMLVHEGVQEALGHTEQIGPNAYATYQPIVVNIYSTGGDSRAGLCAAHLLREAAYKTHVSTVNMGEVSSAAVDIYMAGTNRYALPDSIFMIHQAILSGKRLRAHGLRNLQREWDHEKAALKDLFNELQLTPAQKGVILKGNDLELYYDEAQKVGLITHGGVPWW